MHCWLRRLPLLNFSTPGDNETTRIGTDGVAIVALTTRGPTDLLAFMMDGLRRPSSRDRLGKYVEKDGRVIECEVDVGYGPASYYRNQFLQDVARELVAFTEGCVSTRVVIMALLEKYNVYPVGWTNEGRRESKLCRLQRLS